MPIKKSQVTSFIIIGLVIASVTIFFIYLSYHKDQELRFIISEAVDLSAEKNSKDIYSSTYLRNVIKKQLDNIGMQAGLNVYSEEDCLDPENCRIISLNGKSYRVYFLNRLRPFELSDKDMYMNELLETWKSNILADIDTDFIAGLNRSFPGWQIKKGTMQLSYNVDSFENGEIVWLFTPDITMTKGNMTFKLQDARISIKVRLDQILNLTLNILNIYNSEKLNAFFLCPDWNAAHSYIKNKINSSGPQPGGWANFPYLSGSNRILIAADLDNPDYYRFIITDPITYMVASSDTRNNVPSYERYDFVFGILPEATC